MKVDTIYSDKNSLSIYHLNCCIDQIDARIPRKKSKNKIFISITKTLSGDGQLVLLATF